MTNKWDRQYSYDELIKPVKEIAKEYLTFKKDYTKGMPFKGLPLYGSAMATVSVDKYTFSKTNLEHENEQGRDLIDLLISTSYLYGISTGEYSSDTRNKMYINSLEKLNKFYEEKIQWLQDEVAELKGITKKTGIIKKMRQLKD